MAQRTLRTARPAALFAVSSLVNNINNEEKQDTIATVAKFVIPNPPQAFLDDTFAAMNDPDTINAVWNVIVQRRTTSSTTPPGGLSINEEITVRGQEMEPGEEFKYGEENDEFDQVEGQPNNSSSVSSSSSSSQSVVSSASSNSAPSVSVSVAKDQTQSFLKSLENRLQTAFEWFCDILTPNFKSKLLKLKDKLKDTENSNPNNTTLGESTDTVVAEVESLEYVETVIFVGMVSFMLMAAKCYHPRIATEMTAMLQTLLK